MKRGLFVIFVVAGCSSTIDVGKSGGDNPADGGAPAGALRIFMTATEYTGDLRTAGGASTGIAGADAICTHSADAAGLGGDFIAFLSDDTTDAIDRVVDNGPWYSIAGKMLFLNKSALMTSLPYGSFITDERGGSGHDIWTGTANGGRRTGSSCGGWTGGGYGTAGRGGGDTWLNDTSSTQGRSCAYTSSVMCIERTAAGRAQTEARKRVFVTSSSFTGNLAAEASLTDGFAGGDALCTRAAADAKLGGTFKAWLSGTTPDGNTFKAQDRLNDVGPWYLLDRLTRVFDGKAQMKDPPLHAIDHDELGHVITVPDAGYYDHSDTVWVGGISAASSCKGWTTTINTDGYIGRATVATAGWSSSLGAVCDGSFRLYCFEQ